MAPEVRVDCRYGAPMGRASGGMLEGRVSLRRVRLDSGGYDKGGAYWGHGQPLWYAEGSEDGWRYLRAQSRDAAKKQLADCLGDGARFYR